MNRERFSIRTSYMGMYVIFDDKQGKPLNSREVIELLNELDNEVNGGE